jgi:hypothetical protein
MTRLAFVGCGKVVEIFHRGIEGGIPRAVEWLERGGPTPAQSIYSLTS